MKPSFLDIIMQNSKAKEQPKETPLPVASPPKINFFVLIGSFFAFAFLLYLGTSVLTTKFGWPAFSYIEILKLYAAAAIIKRLIK